MGLELVGRSGAHLWELDDTALHVLRINIGVTTNVLMQLVRKW
jgi:hypothetical protein